MGERDRHEQLVLADTVSLGSGMTGLAGTYCTAGSQGSGVDQSSNCSSAASAIDAQLDTVGDRAGAALVAADELTTRVVAEDLDRAVVAPLGRLPMLGGPLTGVLQPVQTGVVHPLLETKSGLLTTTSGAVDSSVSDVIVVRPAQPVLPAPVPVPVPILPPGDRDTAEENLLGAGADVDEVRPATAPSGPGDIPGLEIPAAADIPAGGVAAQSGYATGGASRSLFGSSSFDTRHAPGAAASPMQAPGGTPCQVGEGAGQGGSTGGTPGALGAPAGAAYTDLFRGHSLACETGWVLVFGPGSTPD